MIFDLYEGDCSVLKHIPPVNCIIINNRDDLFEIVESCPLRPDGSVWITVFDLRNEDGSLRLISEKISLEFVTKGWFLADKVYWFVGKTPDGVIDGKRINRNLPSSGMLLRLTKDLPNKTWTGNEVSSLWERSLSEDVSWYTRQIEYTCPVDGIVLDPVCKNSFIAEACLGLGRQFIGIGKEMDSLRRRVIEIVGD